MTIKDVQVRALEVQQAEARMNRAHQVEHHLERNEYLRLRNRFLVDVLGAIANSDCQDSPAELAAEALKTRRESN